MWTNDGNTEDDMVKVLKKVDEILRLISEVSDTIMFSELEARTAINKATLAHILKSLVQLGYVEKPAKGRYRIGPVLLELADSRQQQDLLQQVAEQEARAVAAELQEGVAVAKLVNGERLKLAKVDVNQTIMVNPNADLNASPYATTTGRVLLAWLPAKERDRIIADRGLPCGEWPEVTTRKELIQALGRIREDGLASYTSKDGQLRTVAVPVLDADDTAPAAIGAGIPAYRFTDDLRQLTIDRLRAAAERIARALTSGRG